MIDTGMLAALRSGTAGPETQRRAADRIKALQGGFDEYAQLHVDLSKRIFDLVAENGRLRAILNSRKAANHSEENITTWKE